MMSLTDLDNAIHGRGNAPAADVAAFDERLVFPSRSSHPEYAALVPKAPGRVVGVGCGASLFHEVRGDSPSPTFFDVLDLQPESQGSEHGA